MARQAKADEEEFARMQAEYEAEQAKKNKDSEVWNNKKISFQ